MFYNWIVENFVNMTIFPFQWCHNDTTMATGYDANYLWQTLLLLQNVLPLLLFVNKAVVSLLIPLWNVWFKTKPLKTRGDSRTSVQEIELRNSVSPYSHMHDFKIKRREKTSQWSVRGARSVDIDEKLSNPWNCVKDSILLSRAFE